MRFQLGGKPIGNAGFAGAAQQPCTRPPRVGCAQRHRRPQTPSLLLAEHQSMLRCSMHNPLDTITPGYRMM